MTCSLLDWTVVSVPVDTALRPGLVFGLATNTDRPCAAAFAALRERCKYESRTRCQTDRPYAGPRCPRCLPTRQALSVLHALGFRLPRGRPFRLPVRLGAVRPVVPQYLVRPIGGRSSGTVGRASDKTHDNGRDLDQARLARNPRRPFPALSARPNAAPSTRVAGPSIGPYSLPRRRVASNRVAES